MRVDSQESQHHCLTQEEKGVFVNQENLIPQDLINKNAKALSQHHAIIDLGESARRHSLQR